MIPIDTTNVPLGWRYINIIFSLFCDYYSIFLLLIFQYIATITSCHPIDLLDHKIHGK